MRETRFTTRNDMLDINKTTEAIIGAAIEMHRHLGPGLLESAYEECLCEELSLRKIPFKRQVALPVSYESILPIHEAQTLTYMRLGGKLV